jgi:hypothetical protein
VNNNIMVKLENFDHQYIRLKTYSRKNGRTWGFLIDKNKLSKFINENTGESYLERDGLNIITINDISEHFSVRIDWLSPGIGNAIHGYAELFEIPKTAVKLLLLNYIQEHKILYTTGRKPVKIENRAARSLREIQKNKYKKRALCKALRDNFKYNGDTIRFYNDGESLYFEDFFNGRCVMNGGLILHQYNARNRAGDHFPAFRYSVHT